MKQQKIQRVAQQQNRILMIEDDEEISELLTIYLQQFNFEVESYADPEQGLEILRREEFSLLILDLSLPKIDGIELLKQLRAFSQIPVIISSARGSVSDKVNGLSLGADDYIPKPYEPIELVARIKAILKRFTTVEFKESFGEFQLNRDKMEILQGEKKLELTKAEYETLKYFLENRDVVLSRERIAEDVESIHWDSVDRTIDVIVSRIRQKIGDSSKSPKYIRSVRGVGYKFT
jgi:two-component system OmpR family response regulator